MKTSSKLFFVLGVLTTLSAVALAYYAIQDTDKSPQELLADSKKFIDRSVRKADHLMDRTSNMIEKETRSILKDASQVI